MSRRKPLRVVVDSTYLLPVFGIGVKGLSDEDILELRRLAVESVVEFYCVSVVWSELIGKVCREMEKHGVSDVDLGLAVKSLFNPRFYRWIKPGPKSVMLAFKIRSLGHVDNIDNILYATAYTRKMLFMSMDMGFKEFLRSKGFNVEIFKTHRELLAMV